MRAGEFSQDGLLQTVALFYESAFDEDRWQEALNALWRLTRGRGVFFITADPATGAIVHSESVNVDPTVNELYRQHFAAQEVRMPPALGIPVGQLMTEGTLLGHRELEQSEIYGDLLLPYDIPYVAALWTEKSRTASSLLVIERSLQQGKFTRGELERLEYLVPHLLRAMEGRQRGLSLRHQAYRQIMDRMPFGVVLLDAIGRVLEMSCLAESLVRLGSGLRYRANRLHAEFADDDIALQQLVSRMTLPGQVAKHPGGTVPIRRSEAAQPLIVNAYPVSGHQRLATTRQPAAILFINDPDGARQPAIQAIRKAYRLSEHEARLACLVFSGCGLPECAHQLGVSVNTCRTQLKSIFLKTGIRSQTRLVRTLGMLGITC